MLKNGKTKRTLEKKGKLRKYESFESQIMKQINQDFFSIVDFQKFTTSEAPSSIPHRSDHYEFLINGTPIDKI